MCIGSQGYRMEEPEERCLAVLTFIESEHA